MKNKTIYTEKCSVRIGKTAMLSFNATWPLAKVTFYDDHVTLQILFKKVNLKFNEIDNIEKYSHPVDVGLGKGIKINHNTSVPAFLAFWPNNTDKIINLFEQKNISTNI